jgi:hypothetical protein
MDRDTLFDLATEPGRAGSPLHAVFDLATARTGVTRPTGVCDLIECSGVAASSPRPVRFACGRIRPVCGPVADFVLSLLDEFRARRFQY